jgi:hypothetical protein
VDLLELDGAILLEALELLEPEDFIEPPELPDDL